MKYLKKTNKGKNKKEEQKNREINGFKTYNLSLKDIKRDKYIGKEA